MIEPYEHEWQRLLREPAVRPIDDVDRAKWAGQEKHMTWDRESNEEYDDGYTRESFERAEEDTPETAEEPRDTKLYRVTWHIDIEAENHEEAAREALRIQRDPASNATVFEVTTDGGADAKEVDLNPEFG